ncbi:MAG: AraC family transcriptional regulator [Devosia sp.]
MDVLSEVLRAVRLTGAVFFDIGASQPWAIASPDMSVVRERLMPDAGHIMPFHLMMAGSAWLDSCDPDAPMVPIETGDIILLPRGNEHCLSSEPGNRILPKLDYYYRPTDQQLPFRLSEIGGGGEPARLVCGYFGCDATPFNPLLDALPRTTIIRAASAPNGRASSFLDAALAEGERTQPGSELVLAKLSELMLVQALRSYIDALPENSEGWLSGLRDPLVGRVLLLLHGEPNRDWTLANLAREVGVSRSVLAERFTRLVHLPPMTYLARWRIQLAARALEQPSASISVVAAEVGYQSEAAFNRAFKKLVGLPPGQWRRARAA